MDSVIRLENIKKSYGDKITTTVLFGVDLNINRGELVAIIGQSGSGKSTLLNIVGTLDKQSSGNVLFEDININSFSNKQLAELKNERIGFIFQFHHLLPEFSVIDNVMMPYYIKKSKFKKDNIDYALELLNFVGMKDYYKRNANALSGGQKQRVAIARALMNKPSIILADEPTGNLDSKTTDQVYDLFRKINRELNTTIVVITHDQKIAQKCDRIIEITDGKIVSDIVK